MNNWKKITYAKVYKLTDSNSERLIYDTSKDNVDMFTPYATHDDFIWKWGVNKFKFNEEGKYKFVLNYADAPMYNNKSTYTRCFFVDKNKPDFIDMIP